MIIIASDTTTSISGDILVLELPVDNHTYVFAVVNTDDPWACFPPLGPW